MLKVLLLIGNAASISTFGGRKLADHSSNRYARRNVRFANEAECATEKDQLEECINDPDDPDSGPVTFTCQCVSEADEWVVHGSSDCQICHSSWGCLTYTFEATSTSQSTWDCLEFSSGDKVCQLLDSSYDIKALLINGEYCASIELDETCYGYIFDCTNLGEGLHDQCNDERGDGTSPYWDFVFEQASDEECTAGECIGTLPTLFFPLKPLLPTASPLPATSVPSTPTPSPMATMPTDETKSLSCFEAHNELYLKEISVCQSSTLTTEEKLTGQCDPECQALLTAVVENCNDGDVVDYDANMVVPYQPAFLYHEFHQNQFTSTWASCDFGYEPTLCDIAYGNLDISRSSIWIFEQIIENEDACLGELNEDACTAECITYIDQVVLHCDSPEQAFFSPIDNFLERTHTILEWNHVESMTLLHFNPLSEDFAYEPLSELCWQYYQEKAELESPTPIFESSKPTEPYFQLCRDTFSELNDSTFYGPCATENECTADCQVLIDDVQSSCKEGDPLDIEDNGSYLEYKGSVLYHEFVFDTFSPISPLCSFGDFQPTPCDVAYGALLSNLDFLSDAGICSEDSEGDSATCSPECSGIINQIVKDCDVPDDSTFSPGAVYSDVLSRFSVIPWVFPDSMEMSGFSPELSYFQTLTEPCWNLYKEQVKLAFAPMQATTTTPTKLATNPPTKVPSPSPVMATTSGPVVAPPSTNSPIVAPVQPPSSSSPSVTPVQPPLARDIVSTNASNAALRVGSGFRVGIVGLVFFVINL